MDDEFHLVQMHSTGKRYIIVESMDYRKRPFNTWRQDRFVPQKLDLRGYDFYCQPEEPLNIDLMIMVTTTSVQFVALHGSSHNEEDTKEQ